MTRPSPPERPPADPKTEESEKQSPSALVHTSAEGLFCPLAGISCNEPFIVCKMESDGFPSPCGENPLSHGLRRASSPDGGSFCSCRYPVLSSPFGRAGAQRLRGFYGEKLKSLLSFSCQRLQSSFRPLTGISCNLSCISIFGSITCFRPLTGISCNLTA